ncbi:helix-turn-helix domain-containing protein [Nocardioides sp. W7]|uniref:IclR family transcriptional regulator n=1 Tax=Nocardioides sp. W7 TaxID=2931390 RepID=UPI001FD289DC|nr:helix-turn-helix domain-containing protein [Nocardioides sp. W7]
MSTTDEAGASSSRTVGSQTLARGLRALQLVASTPGGISVQEVASRLDVHRSIASRVLTTLADFKMIVRGPDARYRVGAGLATLASGVHTTLRDLAEPVLQELARATRATVALLVVEGDEAVALSVVTPPDAAYRIVFQPGSRHPLERGAAGLALLAAGPPRPGEPEGVAVARTQGYAITFGEVEPGAYGVAAPLRSVDGFPAACLNLITFREDVAEASAPALHEAAARLDALLA